MPAVPAQSIDTGAAANWDPAAFTQGTGVGAGSGWAPLPPEGLVWVQDLVWS